MPEPKIENTSFTTQTVNSDDFTDEFLYDRLKILDSIIKNLEKIASDITDFINNAQKTPTQNDESIQDLKLIKLGIAIFGFERINLVNIHQQIQINKATNTTIDELFSITQELSKDNEKLSEKISNLKSKKEVTHNYPFSQINLSGFKNVLGLGD